MKGELTLGALAGDAAIDLRGAVALDHHGRLGVILERRLADGVAFWRGQVVDWRQAAPVKPWHAWTAARPLIVATSLREYAEATDDLLGLEELRRRRDRA